MARAQTQTAAINTIPSAVKGEEALEQTNKIEVKKLNNKIIEYSLIKIRVNPIDPYSTLNPETSSDSPSAKSKGVRLVSAKHEINQQQHNTGIINSIKVSELESITPNSFIDIAPLKNANKIKASLIS